MISKLAKSIAHFFVVQNITEESKEVIYAYGMELLISDVLNTIIVLLIALRFPYAACGCCIHSRIYGVETVCRWVSR